MEILAWVLLSFLVLLGVLGVLLPGLPGVALILLGAVIHKLILPDVLSWWTIAGIGVAALVAWLVDIIAMVLGAKWGGATRLGMAGAAIGGVIGMFAGPMGILVGPVIGAFVGELIAFQQMGRALRSGLAAGAGIAIGTVIRGALAFAAIIAIVIDIFVS